jgi:hypothetical protein
MLHGVRYKKKMDKDNLENIREKYTGNCCEAAYELKTYYAENGILSNTIVLKMRPESPEMQGFESFKVHSYIENEDKNYLYHVIEVFKEHGKYKVLDVLHRDESVWLETYLDELCKTNECKRNRLRYDMGYLAPCHVFAPNMQELTDLMRFLDKVYGVGQPRLNIINLGPSDFPQDIPKEEFGMFLSDDISMNFDDMGRDFGYTGREFIKIYNSVYIKLVGIRFNLLHLLCLGHIMGDQIMKAGLQESMFDDAFMCEMMDSASDIPGPKW